MGFPDDGAILAALKRPLGLSYIAVLLHAPMVRVRDVLARHKTEIVEARLALHQSVEGICLQLDCIDRLDAMKAWILARQHNEEQK